MWPPVDLIQLLQREWATLSTAPATFALTLVLAFGAAYLAVRWRYVTILEILRERLNAQEERLAAKDEQLQEYRQRLHLVSATGTVYTGLSNAEVKQRALELVAGIREFLREHRASETTMLQSHFLQNYQSMTEEERRRAWHERNNLLMMESLNTNADYNARFKVETILLRDELLSRLPSRIKNERDDRLYEHPTNPIGMGRVVDDLERLAKSLLL